MTPNLELPLGWIYPDAEVAALLYAELMRELPVGHLLEGVPVEVVMCRDGNDDTLFRHLNALDRFTVVHLTYLGRTEIGPDFPSVEFDGCFADFLTQQKRIWDELGFGG